MGRTWWKDVPVPREFRCARCGELVRVGRRDDRRTRFCSSACEREFWRHRDRYGGEAGPWADGGEREERRGNATNRERRRRIDDAMVMLDAVKEVVEQVQMEEEEAYGNLSENLQRSARGEAIQEASDALCGAAWAIEEALDCLRGASGEE